MGKAATSVDAGIDNVRSRPGGRSAKVRELVLSAVRAELEERGYGALSHRTVAKRAGVDPATVYRRWSSRPQLAADALLEIASAAVPIPDNGNLEADLTDFLDALAAALSDPGLLQLFHALSAARAEAEGDLRETLHSFWASRYQGAEVMVERAIGRGELHPDVDPHDVIEQLVAPSYFRALVTGEQLDGDFRRRCVASATARR
ncbi:MAG: TetR/AcrR family transcriptional regulator [Solirubrobacterales bacterium]